MEERDYQTELRGIERRVNDQDISLKELSRAIEDLRELVADIKNSASSTHKEYTTVMTSVDKDLAIQEEKLANIFYQLDQLDKRISLLEKGNSDGSAKEKEVISKVLMLVLAALATQIVNALQK